ncbi:unnamed protein product [Allacma fusca]|uniref:Uncharacterized protein n=1 Tax=Allacma fusca TaxID=39272 RepID=A0A8J2NX33_9HEXA|nr:unnamed protein product [Allacma fusca]
MRHLNYFLHFALFLVVHCQEEPMCEKGALSSHSEKICCNGETYNIRRDIEIQNICNAEPKDENLSYEDSIVTI